MTMAFSEYVRKIRRDLDMSQQELAKELNVSFASINRWENKQVSPSNLAKKSFTDFCTKRKIQIPPEMLSIDDNTGE